MRSRTYDFPPGSYEFRHQRAHQTALNNFLKARTQKSRRHWWRRVQQLHESRPPALVAKMERELGLTNG